MNTKTIDAFDRMKTDPAVKALIPDTVLIHTANSTYRFSVIDSVRGFGILTGGVLGDCVVRATLIGLAMGGAETNEGSLERLVAGSRAIFLIASSKAVRRVETSPITKVVRTCMDHGSLGSLRSGERTIANTESHG
ncbi:MAG: hypothetical protein AABO41_22550 [Acidobacteriota bacterium]